MVKVNGVTLIDRMLHQIERLDFSRIVIVVGYEWQKLIDYTDTLDIKTPIEYVFSLFTRNLNQKWLCHNIRLIFGKNKPSRYPSNINTMKLIEIYERRR